MEKQKKPFHLRSWLKENPHTYWALLMLIILPCYLLPEQLVTTGYHATELAIDQWIPFVPAFVYFYVIWFPLLVGMGLWLLVCDGKGFGRYMWFLTAAYVLSCIIYLCYPNGQNLRPAQMEVNSLSTWILSRLYGIDTNTNVLPSLHVIGSLGVCFAVGRTPSIHKRWIRVFVMVLSFFVAISTVFVKQHALIDLVAGAVVGVAIELVMMLLCHRRDTTHIA